MSGRVTRVFIAFVAQLVERGADNLDDRAVLVRKFAVELLPNRLVGEHNCRVPIRPLVDHELPPTRAEDVETKNLLALTRDVHEILERQARPGMFRLAHATG